MSRLAVHVNGGRERFTEKDSRTTMATSAEHLARQVPIKILFDIVICLFLCLDRLERQCRKHCNLWDRQAVSRQILTSNGSSCFQCHVDFAKLCATADEVG